MERLSDLSLSLICENIKDFSDYMNLRLTCRRFNYIASTCRVKHLKRSINYLRLVDYPKLIHVFISPMLRKRKLDRSFEKCCDHMERYQRPFEFSCEKLIAKIELSTLDEYFGKVLKYYKCQSVVIENSVMPNFLNVVLKNLCQYKIGFMECKLVYFRCCEVDNIDLTGLFQYFKRNPLQIRSLIFAYSRMVVKKFVESNGICWLKRLEQIYIEQSGSNYAHFVNDALLESNPNLNFIHLDHLNELSLNAVANYAVTWLKNGCTKDYVFCSKSFGVQTNLWNELVKKLGDTVRDNPGYFMDNNIIGYANKNFFIFLNCKNDNSLSFISNFVNFSFRLHSKKHEYLCYYGQRPIYEFVALKLFRRNLALGHVLANER